MNMKNGKIRSVCVQPFHSAWSSGPYIGPPALFTKIMAAIVIPRKTSSDTILPGFTTVCSPGDLASHLASAALDAGIAQVTAFSGCAGIAILRHYNEKFAFSQAYAVENQLSDAISAFFDGGTK